MAAMKGVDEAPADRGVDQLNVPAREAALRFERRERRARHRLDPARENEVGLAEANLAGGLDRRLQAGRAEPVDRQARHRRGQAREQGGHARDVAVVLARLVRAAQVDLLDARGVQLVALDGGSDHAGGQIVRAHAGEDAAVAADRRAQSVDNHGFPHLDERTLGPWTSSPSSSCSASWSPSRFCSR
jgi:hypothetical protein